jgi:hypothetical protein
LTIATFLSLPFPRSGPASSHLDEEHSSDQDHAEAYPSRERLLKKIPLGDHPPSSISNRRVVVRQLRTVSC